MTEPTDWVPYGTPNPRAAAEMPDKDFVGAPAIGTSPAYNELQSNPQTEHTFKTLGPDGPLPVFKAFTSGFHEGFGDDPVGMGPEKIKEFQDAGVFRGKPGPNTPFQDVFRSANEVFYMGGAMMLDAAARTGTGLYRAVQAAGVEAGAPRDVMSIPDAFMGAPGIGLDHPAPTVKPSVLQSVQDLNWKNRNILPLPRSVAGRTGIPEVDLVLNSWPTRNVIDNPVIDRSHDVPYMAGGSAPLADPTVYVDRHVPRTQTVSGITFDPADPWTIHENVEQHTMELLIRGGMSASDAYKVAHFEFAEPAEQAWYRSHGIDQVEAEKEQMSWLPKIQHENPENPPPNLYEKPYPHSHVQGAEHESVEETRPSDAAVLRAKAIIRNTPELKNLTHSDIAQARETGVIGPEKKGINEGTPAEVAHRTIQPTVAYHGSPYDFDAFDSGRIGTGEGAQSYGHGLYFAEHPEVSGEYARRLGDTEAPVLEGSMWKVRYKENGEWAERDFKTQKEANQFANPGNHYQVKIHANKDDFLDWDKPLSEQSPSVQKALKKLGTEGNVDGLGEDHYREVSKQIAAGKLRNENSFPPSEAASAALAEAGVPGIKYLDQESRTRAASAPIDAPRLEKSISEAKQTLSEIQEQVKQNKDNPGLLPAYFERRAQEIKEVQASIDRWQTRLDTINSGSDLTHNFVVFDHNLVEITHKNGEVVPPKPSSLPVPVEEAMPAKQGGRELMSPEDTAFAQRLDEFIGKLEVPEDFKNLLREAAQRGGTFPEARTGDIPLSHQGSLEEATGMRLDEMTLRGMGRLLKNDAEVRVAMQTLLKTTDDTFEAARTADMTGDPKDLIALQEAIMRRDLALEQVVGLRAEWGRTGNVFQEFTEKVNDAQTLGQFLKDKGKYTVDDLKTIAKNLRGLNDRGAQARLLTDLRKPTLWDKWMYVWTNGLLSGLFTHARYIVGNTMFAAYDAMVIIPTAGLIGAGRQLFNKEAIDRVFIGEGPARVWGMVNGTMQGIMSAAKAIETGVPDALPRQVALNVNPYTGQKPIKGVVGSIIGIPSHAIAAIHTFYNVIGYRAQIEAEAYRSAAKAGLKPTDPNFWTHMHDQAMFPTEDAMDAAVKNGSRITFTDPLGPKGQALQVFLNTTKVGKMVVPFLRVSSNVFKAAQEATPGALLNKDMRDNLAGKNGDIARDTQYARLAVGTAIGGMVAYWAANDHITDNGPPNKEDHDIWRLTHEPNSIKIGGYWVSYDRLGPLGPYLGMVASLTHSIKDTNDKDVGTAAERITLGISQDIVNEVGMQGLSDLIMAKTDPARYGKKYLANLGASFIPFSSGASQWAGAMDPYQRTTNNLVDVLKSKVPYLRETLYPVRDWKGLPLANSREEIGAVIKNRAVNGDPIDQEMSSLGIHPTKVEQQIKGVQLDPGQYDRYQTVAGVLTQTALEKLVTSEGWSERPALLRENLIKTTIEATRKAAETQMLMEKGGALLKKTLQVQVDKAQGIKPDKSKTLMQTLGVTP